MWCYRSGLYTMSSSQQQRSTCATSFRSSRSGSLRCYFASRHCICCKKNLAKNEQFSLRQFLFTIRCFAFSRLQDSALQGSFHVRLSTLIIMTVILITVTSDSPWLQHAVCGEACTYASGWFRVLHYQSMVYFRKYQQNIQDVKTCHGP